MISGVLGKILIPVIAAVVMGFGGYAAGVYQVSNRPLEVKTPQAVCNCDCPDPVNTIDIEKLKNFKGNFTLNQNYSFKSNGDTLALRALVTEINKELAKLKIVKCK